MTALGLVGTLLDSWQRELCRALPEHKRILTLSDRYFYALIDAGEAIAECSCHPHATGALDIIEEALDYKFKRRYPENPVS